MASEGVMNKAASISSFSAKTIFTKYGKAAIKNSNTNETDLKHHDVLHERNDHSMELLNFKRKDSALPDFEDLQIRLSHDNHKEYMGTPTKSRKVKSVLDFTEGVDNMFNEGHETNDDKKHLHVEWDEEHDMSSSNNEINSEG